MKLATALLLFACAQPVAAQTSRTDPVDVQAWAGTSLTLDLPKRWEASLEYQLRMVEDAATYRGSYITTEVQRRLNDYISAYTSYRLALVDGGSFHRIAIGAQANYERDALTLSFRPSLQYQQRNFEDSDEGDSDMIVRTRLRARYDLTDPLDVYASVEPYFKFGADYPIDNWRNTLGMRYEIIDGVRIDAFYIYRPDYARSYNRTFHIIGIDLGFTLKP